MNRQGSSHAFAATVLLDGVSYGMILFLISVGLTVTMGLMRVVNLAHGSFAMIGGYIAGYFTQRGYDFYLALLVATIVSGILGGLAEVTVSFAKDCIVLDRGKIVHRGPSDALKGDHDAHSRLLGVAE